jgi:hypothetical protein
MARPTKQQKDYNGFAMPLQPATDLGNAILIPEDDDGNYEQVSVSRANHQRSEGNG